MTDTPFPGGRGRIGERDVARVGYGAMQLDPDSVSVKDAVAVLHRAVELGVNHVDTASFYAFGEVNHRIRRALAPYRDDLVLVSKVGARSASGPIPLQAAQKPAELRAAVEEDVVQLGLDRRSSRSALRSPASPRSATTPWYAASPPKSTSHQRKSGSHGCWPTRRTHSSSQAPGRSRISRRTLARATSSWTRMP